MQMNKLSAGYFQAKKEQGSSPCSLLFRSESHAYHIGIDNRIPELEVNDAERQFNILNALAKVLKCLVYDLVDGGTKGNWGAGR